jgi:tellurite resistance protein TerC
MSAKGTFLTTGYGYLCPQSAPTMTPDQIVYTVFSVVLVAALVFDLGLMSKANRSITIRQALHQTFFWVGLALAFFIFLWIEEGQLVAFEYISAYAMEWSLSIDNIFVFIIIFSAFGVREKHFSRVLLIGILMAIAFRFIFITVGVALVERFHWLLYVFGAFLVYTGFKLFTATEDEEFKPKESIIYRWMRKFIPLVSSDAGGKFVVKRMGRRVYTTLFVVVVMLAATDLVFALDSIPAVMGISRNVLVIYTSNIFAVLGLRSLFFLLRGAVSKFDHLQQGIAIVLVFIGVKMLGEHWINQWVDKQTMVMISLLVIITCLSGSIFYSIFVNKRGLPPDVRDESVS